jgi:hypothetical protein
MTAKFESSDLYDLAPAVVGLPDITLTQHYLLNAAVSHIKGREINLDHYHSLGATWGMPEVERVAAKMESLFGHSWNNMCALDNCSFIAWLLHSLGHNLVEFRRVHPSFIFPAEHAEYQNACIAAYLAIKNGS